MLKKKKATDAASDFEWCLCELLLFFCDADEIVDYNSKPQFSHYPCYDVD